MAELRLHAITNLGRMMSLAQRVEDRERVKEKVGTMTGQMGNGSGSGSGMTSGLSRRPTLHNRPNSNNGLVGTGNRFSAHNGGNTRIVGQSNVFGLTNSQASNSLAGGQAEISTSIHSVANGDEGNPISNNGSRGAKLSRLSPEELNDRRQRNLCFRCDAPYSTEHVSRNPTLNFMFLGVGESIPENVKIGAINERDGVELGEMLQLSIQSIVGLTSSRSLKLWGEIKGREVMILFDTGASHSFLAERVAHELQFEIEDTRGFSVEVGDGLTVGKGVIVAMTLAEAYEAVDSMLVKGDFGSTGCRVIVEEFLERAEVSFFAMVDGENAIPLESAQDHKRVGDTKPNPFLLTMGLRCFKQWDPGEKSSHIICPFSLP